MKQSLALGMAIVVAGAALAHQGVQNPGVMARMETMSVSKKAMNLMADMASGARRFDAEQAQTALVELTAALEEVPERFKEPHEDPKTEALPIIWQQYDDFLALNTAAIKAVAKIDPASRAQLQATLTPAGVSCLDCHKTYRKEVK
ncbi:MAG: cytochrome c [Aliishimia sp.]